VNTSSEKGTKSLEKINKMICLIFHKNEDNDFTLFFLYGTYLRIPGVLG